MKKGILENEAEGLVTLTAVADRMLADIWDNDKDAAYDMRATDEKLRDALGLK